LGSDFPSYGVGFSTLAFIRFHSWIGFNWTPEIIGKKEGLGLSYHYWFFPLLLPWIPWKAQGLLVKTNLPRPLREAFPEKERDLPNSFILHGLGGYFSTSLRLNWGLLRWEIGNFLIGVITKFGNSPGLI